MGDHFSGATHDGMVSPSRCLRNPLRKLAAYLGTVALRKLAEQFRDEARIIQYRLASCGNLPSAALGRRKSAIH